jgi:primosomal protein N' (replication factor Y)
MLSRPELTTTEETFAKWMECVSLVRPGGEVVVVADPEHHAVQALIRHDPAGFAQRELEQRQQVQLPPAVRLVALTGTLVDIDDLLAITELPEGVTQRGPVPVGEGSVRMLLSVARAQGVALAGAVKAATVIRSAKHKGQPVNVRVDPYDI